MKLGVLGTGMIVREVLPVFERMGIVPSAILGTERSRARTMELAERFHIPAPYFQYGELLAGDVDTVYVALPNTLHYLYAREALLRGKHVIVEKPITLTVRELDDLAALAKASGKLLAEAMTLHYLPAYQCIRQQLYRLGQVRIVSLNFSQYSSRYDAFLRGTVSPSFDVRQGGGALTDLNIYNIHFAAGLFGAPQAVHYCANIQDGVDTSGVLTLDYGGMTAACIGAKDCSASNVSTIQGEKGTIVFDVTTNKLDRFELVGPDGCRTPYEFAGGRHRMEYEFDAFARMIESHRTERAAELLEISRTATGILEAGRKQILP